MENLEFYKCETCGSVKVDIVTDLDDCCNTDMIMMVPNTVDAAIEKHMPVASFDGEYLNVKVGEVAHPMTNEHLIDAIYIVTDNGIISKKTLTSLDKPEYSFKIDNANVVDVYVSCNIHGVWKKTFNR